MNIIPSGIKTLVTRNAAKGLQRVSRYSPELLVAGGIVGVVTGAILTGRAAVRTAPVSRWLKKEVETVREREDITQGEKNKDIAQLYVRTGLEITKEYVPAATFIVVGIACFLSAHGIMKKRNVALLAAYKTLEESYNSYREKVIEQLGEDKDLEYRFDVEEVDGKDENGKKTKLKRLVKGNKYSPYARFFDMDTSTLWSPAPEYNLMFLRSHEKFANDKLQRDGFLFLNDVYEALGLEKSPEGQLVGWLAEHRGIGDGYVSFGIFDDEDTFRVSALMDGSSDCILLDFNVDGVIWDQI